VLNYNQILGLFRIGRDSPIFRTYQIDNAVFSDDKILREKSGEKIGKKRVNEILMKNLLPAKTF